MMAVSPFVLARDLWVLFGVYWLVAALKRKETKKRETSGQRLAYVAPLILAFILLAEPWMSRGWMGTRLFPFSETAAWIGLALVAGGVALAFWARQSKWAILRRKVARKTYAFILGFNSDVKSF
jgi:hypothetical protein